jgi:hypothetical protein
MGGSLVRSNYHTLKILYRVRGWKRNPQYESPKRKDLGLLE